MLWKTIGEKAGRVTRSTREERWYVPERVYEQYGAERKESS